MTPLEYFEQGRWLPQRIEQLRLQSQNIREQMMRISSLSFDREFTTGTRSIEAPQVKMLSKAMEIEAETLREFHLNLCLKEQMIKIIKSMESQQDQVILTYRFMNNMNWTEIGMLMHCDRKTASKWCDQALDNVCLPVDAIDLREK